MGRAIWDTPTRVLCGRRVAQQRQSGQCGRVSGRWPHSSSLRDSATTADADESSAARTRPVLLTGASGLLGQWLVRTAPHGTGVIALTRRHSIPGIPEVHADLRDARSTMTAVKRADPSLVIHAAYAHDRAAIVDATEHVVAFTASRQRRSG
jgi:hypothetical protein